MAEKHGVVEHVTGAVVILVAAAFLVYAISSSGRATVSGYPLQARFDRIDGLTVGSDVRIAGVKVGSVTDARIDPKDFTALVAFTVRSDLRIPRDSSAEITSEGLLGGKYVSISPGGDDATLRPGQTITITQSSISLEQLLGKFIFNLSPTPKPEETASPSGGATKQ